MSATGSVRNGSLSGTSRHGRSVLGFVCGSCGAGCSEMPDYWSGKSARLTSLRAKIKIVKISETGKRFPDF